MSSPMIECKSLGFQRESKMILRDFNCSIKAGELVSLLGPNGSGKTSFLRLCAGFERPVCGEIRLRGEVVSDQKIFVPPGQRGIGFVFQNMALFEKVSVEKNIFYGCKTKDHREEALRLIRVMGLWEHLKKFPSQLSGGERQKLALIRSLAVKPDIMFLDEPFSSIDRIQTETLIKEIVKLFEDLGMTALMVTHSQKESELFSSRTLSF